MLEHKNKVYLGENMEDSLGNPIQSEYNEIRVHTRPNTIIIMQRTFKLYFTQILQGYLLSMMVYYQISQSGSQQQM